MKNVAKNFFYQSIFQVVKIIMPIITIPIVSNALGPQGIGVYNYTFSIAQYFVLIAGLGVTIYGNREIALAWHRNKDEVSKVFWEIVIFKGISTLIISLIYLVFISFATEKLFLLAQLFTILAVMVDISWFFMGIEDFKKTSMSNLIIQCLVFLTIILFIKNENDALKYTLIQSLGIFLSQGVIWVFIFKYVHFIPIKLKNCFSHLKGAIEYFIPQVAILLYTNLNKTILGIFLGSVAVGYYSNSLQLNSVFITIITTVDLVLLPHMTGLFAGKNLKRIVKTMEKTLHTQLFFSIPIMFGMLTIFDKLVPWFFGEKFMYIINIIPFFSVLIVVIPLGMSISRQYLMPIGRIKDYNKSVIYGAVINIISNIMLLPTIGFFGVVISNVIAELFVTYTRTKSFLKSTSFRFDLKKILTYLVASFIMCLTTRMITKEFDASFITNLIQVAIAVPIYFFITIVTNTNPIIILIKEFKDRK